MLCERCKKNEATFYYHENINGKQKTYRLCPECEAEMEKNGELKEFDADKMFEGFDSFLTSPFGEMHNLLSSMFGGNRSKAALLSRKEGRQREKMPCLRNYIQRIRRERYGRLPDLLRDIRG